jgi:AAA15 family ATPase/GTPase
LGNPRFSARNAIFVFAMQKLIIKNFGPVKDVELDVNDFMVFIGPQASGKSTIAKAVYFFKSIRDDLIEVIDETIKTNDSTSNQLILFYKKITKKYLRYWGLTQHLRDFQLDYEYKSGYSLHISRKLVDQQYMADPVPSARMKEAIQSIFRDTKTFIAQNSSKHIQQSLLDVYKKEFLQNIITRINTLFAASSELIFIPAGRSLIATLSNQTQLLDTNQLDYLTQIFILRIGEIRREFSGLPQSVMRRTTSSLNREQQSAIDLIDKILKGRYRYFVDRNEERIYYDNSNFIPLNFASSGQQESLWILLLIYNKLLRVQQQFVVIEEPEAHLFPEAQNDIIQLIALLANRSENQTIITTHSPYILASINNLLYAHNIGQRHRNDVSRVVNNQLWLDYSKMGAYFVENGTIRNILEDDLKMIKNEEIDTASSIINAEYDKISEIEFQK